MKSAAKRDRRRVLAAAALLRAEQMRRTRAGPFQMGVMGNLGTSPDGADTFLRAYSPGIGGQNLARFKLPERDALFDRQHYAIDPTYPWVLNQRRWPFIPDWWRYADIDLDLQRTLTS